MSYSMFVYCWLVLPVVCTATRATSLSSALMLAELPPKTSLDSLTSLNPTVLVCADSISGSRSEYE